ncbi:PE family protein, partial [Mycobacterium gordonae]|uniref:PE family protein n=1 Tax=Mycobacterium gordonae TaxID=1778 RepID=UPI003AFFE69A
MASDLTGINSALGAVNQQASAVTTRVLAAAGDEVSMAIAAIFGAHGEQYQQASAQAARFHEQFVRALAGGANAYASAEAATIDQLVLGLINAPTNALLGRPLIGDGFNGAEGTGANGGAGGILWGNGGNGGSGAPGQAGGRGGDA